MFDNLTIMQQTVSAQVKTPLDEVKNVKVLSDASAALRQNYHPTNEILGEGSFGKVFVFTSRGELPLKKYAVKVLLKSLMGRHGIEDIRREI